MTIAVGDSLQAEETRPVFVTISAVFSANPSDACDLDQEHASPISILPFEVLQQIFETATFVPDAFDMGVLDVFRTPPPLTIDEQREALQRALSIKSSIVQVCATWYSIGLRLLYQSIMVTKERGLQALHDTLKAPSCSVNRCDKCLLRGSWVRRLDIAFNHTTPSEHSWSHL